MCEIIEKKKKNLSQIWPCICSKCSSSFPFHKDKVLVPDHKSPCDLLQALCVTFFPAYSSFSCLLLQAWSKHTGSSRTAQKPRGSPHSDVCPSVPKNSGLTHAFSLSKIGALCHQLQHHFSFLLCCVFPSLHLLPLDVLYICFLDCSLHESIDFVLFTAISQALIQSLTCIYTIHNG